MDEWKKHIREHDMSSARFVWKIFFPGGRGFPYESDVRGCSSTLVGLSVADLGLSWAVQDEKLIFLSLQISLWVV